MNTEPNLVRSFVAIELPPNIRALLETVQDELSESIGTASGRIRWVRSEGIHLTLQFLGDVPEDSLPAIGHVLQQAAKVTGPFLMNLGSLGAFPNPRRPRVIWVGLETDETTGQKLNVLYNAVADGLTGLGFAPDKRFQPHLTLGRIREGTSAEDLESISNVLLYSEAQPRFEASFRVGGISLMKSVLQPAGAVYTQIAHAELKQA